jgi:hypothetical protein
LRSLSIKILLLISFVSIAFIYPYSKQIKLYKAEDIRWETINKSKQYKEFDPASFTFKKIVYFSPEIQKLDHTDISIKGFIKKEKQGDQEHLLLTETVTEVCFMCNHDEMYNFIELIPNENESELNKLKKDSYIEVEGVFMIKRNQKEQSHYILDKAELVKIITE